MDSELCSYCRNINFEALRNPLTSDITSFQSGNATAAVFQNNRRDVDKTHARVLLGSFSRIITASRACRLCALIVQVLQRHHPVPVRPEQICAAFTDFYGLYHDPRDSGKVLWSRRMSVRVQDSRADTYIGGAYHAFQACLPGAGYMVGDVEGHFGSERLPEIDKMVFGGRKRPMLVDLSWVAYWIRLCQEQHGETCRNPVGSKAEPFQLIRFIDVEQRSIVTFENEHPRNLKYLALSYVWGGPQELTLNTSNAAQLALSGALQVDELPETITDAVNLTKALSITYLWCDALCILQDSDSDKSVQIRAMSKIYNQAFITIIAAASDNAHAGLPGLRPDTRSGRQDEVFVIKSGPSASQLSLLTTLEPVERPENHYLAQTAWNTRGWTMQERVLAHRALTFTKEQVYWACPVAVYCEETHFETPVRFNRFHDNALEMTLQRSFRNFYEANDPQDNFWGQYQKLVARFSRRNFTYDGDVHDGFSAIVDGLASLSGETFLWGMPRSRFDTALMWTSFTTQHRRTELSTLPITVKNVRVHFPSWSWMGWKGESWVSVRDDRQETGGESSEIVSYVHHTSPLQLLAISNSASPSRWGKPHKFNMHLTVSVQDVEAHLRHLQDRLRDIPDETLLFFWANTAKLMLAFNSLEPEVVEAPAIVDDSGTVIGGLGKVNKKEFEKTAPEDGWYDFVVIGSRNAEFDFIKPRLLVLQIKWLDGVAYRINTGEVDEDAWAKAKPGRRLVVLG